jgi:hypothetical protein
MNSDSLRCWLYSVQEAKLLQEELQKQGENFAQKFSLPRIRDTSIVLLSPKSQPDNLFEPP